MTIGGPILIGLVHFKKMYKFKLYIHIMWMILGVITIIGFLGCFLYGLLSIGLMESCTAIGDILSVHNKLILLFF